MNNAPVLRSPIACRDRQHDTSKAVGKLSRLGEEVFFVLIKYIEIEISVWFHRLESFYLKLEIIYGSGQKCSELQ